jgi:hypothetical protein
MGFGPAEIAEHDIALVLDHFAHAPQILQDYTLPIADGREWERVGRGAHGEIRELALQRAGELTVHHPGRSGRRHSGGRAQIEGSSGPSCKQRRDID